MLNRRKLYLPTLLYTLSICFSFFSLYLFSRKMSGFRGGGVCGTFGRGAPRGRGVGGPRAPPTFRSLSSEKKPIKTAGQLAEIQPRLDTKVTLNSLTFDTSKLANVNQYELRFYAIDGRDKKTDLSMPMKNE